MDDVSQAPISQTVEEASLEITTKIMQEIRAVRLQNAEMRKAMTDAGLTPPNEDPNYDALVTAITEMQEKSDSIEGKEGAFKAEVYRDAAAYARAARRRGDVRWNEACEAIESTMLGLAQEQDGTQPTEPVVA